HDERQADVEERQRVKGEREVSEGDDDPADEYTAILAEPAICDEAPEDRRDPHAADVIAIDGAGVRIGEAERLRHVQDQEPPHPVVAEPLPHFGEEKRGETAGVAEPRGARRGRRHSTSWFGWTGARA